jgi:hypothetical protein
VSLSRSIALLAVLVALGGGLAWRLLRTPAADARTAEDAAEREKPPLRVLFVGNSYTFVNDLPSLVRKLASAAGEATRLEAVQECPGGSTLKQHWESGRAAALLHESHFDWMVMQDQSEVPSFERNQLERDMYPYVEKLYQAARDERTRTLLYMTWGHRDGDPRNVRGDDYAAMQRRLETGYETIAGRLRLPVAPVGVAWKRAVSTPGVPSLWAADGSHPSVAGSYLAACVLYQSLYGHTPLGNAFDAGLDAATAGALQRIAAETVGGYAQP